MRFNRLGSTRYRPPSTCADRMAESPKKRPIGSPIRLLLICSTLLQLISASENDNSPTEPGVAFTQIVDPPKNTKVILGLTAKLSCGVKSESPVNIEWFFNKQQISKSSTGRITVQDDGTLRIEQARNTDVGLYNCTVTSEKGNDWRTARLDLIEIPHPPLHVKAELLSNSALVNVSYSAPFDGNSPIINYVVQKRIIPNYHESGNDAVVDVVPFTDVDLNITATQNFVIVGNLRPASTYQFRVIAVNSVGKGQPSNPTSPPVTLPAQPPSSPPIGVVGAARSSTTIYIQFSPPPTDGLNGQLRGYIVRFKLAGYHDTVLPWFYKNITNAGQLTYILDDLIVWKNYEIQVAAYNEVGVGSYSQSIYIRTKEGKPASAPSRVDAQAISATAIEVSWFGPDPQLINGINQGYKIRAFNTMDNTTKEVQVEPSSIPDNLQKAIIPNLEPFTEYLINVLCYTSAGDGPPNDPMIAVKTQQGLPSEISSIKFFNVLDSSLDVEWAPPKKVNGELVGFTLKYAAVDKLAGVLNQELKVQNFSESVLQAHIVDLKPETLYRFEINAWTRVGPGDSKVATVKSGIPPVLPEPPIKLAISNIGPRSVVLQFTPGFNGNSTITKWLVEAQLTKTKNGTWTMIYESINPNQLDAITVHHLKPYTGYRLRLIPVNIVGRSIRPSEPSPPFQTFQAPPNHPPLNVTTQSFNPSTILVQWLPLVNEWNGEPRGFNVTWRELNDEQMSNYNVQMNYHVTESPNTGAYLITGLRNVTEYAVQVFAVNDVGSSNGSEIQIQRTSDKILAMPSNLELKTKFPFYFEKWFVSSVAGLMIMFTFLLIAGLCIHNSSYKYNHQQKHSHPHQQINNSHDGISDTDFGLDDNLENPYAAGFELRTNGGPEVNNYRRANQINMALGATASKSPPRPAPGSLAYSDDDDLDDDTKENLYGSSAGSVTEKPSESSSPESESERDEDDLAVNHHFVNHYANVNDTLKKGHPSWKKQAHSYIVRSNHDLAQSSSSGHNPYAPSTSQHGLNNLSHNGTMMNGHSTHSSNLPPLPSTSGHNMSSNNLNGASNMSMQDLHPSYPMASNSMANSMNTNMNNMSNSMNNNMNNMSSNMNMSNNNMTNMGKPRISPPTISSQVPPLPSYNNHPMMSSAAAAADESDIDSPSNMNNLNGGRIVMNNMAGSRAPLPGFSSFV